VIGDSVLIQYYQAVIGLLVLQAETLWVRDGRDTLSLSAYIDYGPRVVNRREFFGHKYKG
jgi:hypothetical protein